jgi:hypothetical protein
MLVDFEDSLETAIERLGQLGLTEQQLVDGFIYRSPDSSLDVVARAHVESSAWGKPLGVIVVDSMTEAMAVEGLDPDRGKDVTKFYSLLRDSLAELGAAVVILDHVTKSHEARGRWAIGSERKISGLNGAAYSFNATQEFGRGVTGKIKLRVSKDRPGFVRSHTVKGAIGTLTLASSPDDGRVTAQFDAPSGAGEVRDAAATQVGVKAAMLEAVRDNPGLTSTELRPLVSGDTTAKSHALKALVDEGAVRVEKVGRKHLHYAT